MPGTIFFSSLMTETNSFSNIPIAYADFEAEEIKRGDAIFRDEKGNVRAEIEPLVCFADERGLTLKGGITASAAPGAPVQHDDYLRLRDELLDALRAQEDVKAVFLTLHGAMMSTDCDDCEGDVLAHVRAIVGDGVPVGVVLDPHAHLTDAMTTHADILAFMKEYPHIDGIERGKEVLALMGQMLDGEINPVPAIFDCRLMGFFPTQDQPMRGFVDGLMDKEKADGVLSISFVHGFPWGDMPDAGAKVLAYADGDENLAKQTAEAVFEEIWAIKDAPMPPLISIEDAMDRVRVAGDRPVILSDIADNPGGGAPSDSTFLLSAFLEAELRDIAIGLIYDPEAVRACHKIGPGGQLDLRIGGKMSRFSGNPVDISAKVVDVRKDARMDVLGITDFPMGDTAWITDQWHRHRAEQRA